MATETGSQPVSDGIGTWVLAHLNKTTVQVVTIGLFILGWEIAGQLTSPLMLAPFSEAVRWSFELLGRPSFVSDLQTGLWSVVVGVGIGLLSGLIIGILMGTFPIVENLLDPYFTVLYSLPIVALIPFIVLLFGSGFAPRVFIIWLFAFIPMVINSVEGAKETPQDLREVAVSFGASQREIVRYVFLPSMIPYVITGSRLGIGRGLRGWILAELFFLIGVGGRLIEFATQFNQAGVFAVLFMFILIGVGATQLIYMTSDIVAPWYDPESEGDEL